MDSARINNVSDTALWVAAFRAEETERPSPAFRDVLAKKLAGERGRQFMLTSPNRGMLSYALTVRTTAIDKLVESAVSRGVQAVLNMGAGLDTRPYRMNLPATLKWIEIDLPGIINYKNDLLASDKPVCNLKRIAFDLSNDAERDGLFGELGKEAAKMLVITEGVIAYLTNEQAAKLSASIYRVPSFSYWIMDYSQGKLYRKRSRKLEKMVESTPFRFDEESPLAFFGRDGWVVKEDIHIVDEAVRIGRRFPLMFPWNILMRLFKGIRKKANDTYGYVLLGRP